MKENMTSKRKLLTADDVNGAWAIMPTPAKEGASDWRMEDTVDLDETARVVEELIKSGVNAIVSIGTFGEGATLTWEEKRNFIVMWQRLAQQWLSACMPIMKLLNLTFPASFGSRSQKFLK
jgi:hypothetical protein